MLAGWGSPDDTDVVGRVADSIDEGLAGWLAAQPVFFVATAPLARDGRVNCSPKGNRGELSVPDASTVAYLDQTGSGVETVAHIRENGRIVVMWAAFEGPPRIVRVHGTGRVVRVDDPEFAALAATFPAMTPSVATGAPSTATEDVQASAGYGAGDPVVRGKRQQGDGATGPCDPPVGTRSIIVVHVERVSDSCGYGVPLLTFDDHRATMDQWAERKGRPGIVAYQEQHNATSIDGLPGLPGLPGLTARPPG